MTKTNRGRVAEARSMGTAAQRSGSVMSAQALAEKLPNNKFLERVYRCCFLWSNETARERVELTEQQIEKRTDVNATVSTRRC